MFLSALVAMFAPLLVVAGTANARPIVTAKSGGDDIGDVQTAFSFRDRGPTSCLDETPCTATFVVKRRGKVVLRETQKVDGLGGTDTFYAWTCKRAGRHTWTASYTGGNGTVPTPPSSGKFTIGKCGRTKYRVSKARAQAAAARGFPVAEFVSRSRCRSQPPGRRLSADWLCAVTHNNNIRECVTNYGVHYYRYTKFGRSEVRDSQYRGHRRCRAF